jgi:hypothetical protein
VDLKDEAGGVRNLVESPKEEGEIERPFEVQDVGLRSVEPDAT